MGSDTHIPRKCFQTSMFGEDVKCTNCCLLPDNNIFLTEHMGYHVHILNPVNEKWETFEFDHYLYDVALLGDRKAVVLASGLHGFQPMDLLNFQTTHRQSIGGSLTAVSAFGDNIVVRNDHRKLSVMDINGKVLHTINTKYDPWYFTADKNNCVYWTNGKHNEVHCEQIRGLRRFAYHNANLLHPSGLTLDKFGTLYVAGYESNNVIQLSEGQSQSQILNEQDGIRNPYGIAYNDNTDELIVLNDNGTSICIYKLK